MRAFGDAPNARTRWRVGLVLPEASPRWNLLLEQLMRRLAAAEHVGQQVQHFVLGQQAQLDILPVLFETVKIVRHRGCNLASWNVNECKRELINGNLLINGEYPIIFIHFSQILANEILRGHDPLLSPYLINYKSVFEEDGVMLSNFMNELDTHLQAGILKKVKWKLKARTRIKRFFYKLAQSL